MTTPPAAQAPLAPLPDFIIIGAQKSATRWLRDNLGRHPGIFAAKSEISFFNNTERYEDEGIDWYRRQFEKLNIHLEIRATDWNRFQEKIRSGNTQIFFLGWNADYPDPENFMFLLNGPQSRAKTQGENAANYQNPEYDRLFERMKNLDNGPERQAIIDRMLRIAREDAPWAWGYHPKDYSLAHQWVFNSKPNQIAPKLASSANQ